MLDENTLWQNISVLTDKFPKVVLNVSLSVFFCYFLVDRRTVTFDIKSTPRTETEEKSSPYTGEGASFVDDTMTMSSEVEPSVMSFESQALQASKPFISLKPNEQVSLQAKDKLGDWLKSGIQTQGGYSGILVMWSCRDHFWDLILAI